MAELPGNPRERVRNVATEQHVLTFRLRRDQPAELRLEAAGPDDDQSCGWKLLSDIRHHADLKRQIVFRLQQPNRRQDRRMRFAEDAEFVRERKIAPDFHGRIGRDQPNPIVRHAETAEHFRDLCVHCDHGVEAAENQRRQ